MRELFTATEMQMDADISECGTYRYMLSRVWDESLPLMTWIMLNPSTADHTKDDPTIRRCIGFAKDWGYGGLFVVNLFALRATNPRELYATDDPIGPRNDQAICTFAAAAMTVAAWGNHGTHQDRGREVVNWLRKWGVDVHCLGTTKANQPKHPLYLAANTKPIPYELESPDA